MAGSTLVIRNTGNNEALPYMNLIDSLKMIGPLSLFLVTGACSNPRCRTELGNTAGGNKTEKPGLFF
jgi:hypothetical protein